MRFSDLTPIELSVLSQSSVYSNSQPRPRIHDRQLDWRRLYTLINDNSEQLLEVKAGLAEDWVRTHGTVWDVKQGFHRRPTIPMTMMTQCFGAILHGRPPQSWLRLPMNAKPRLRSTPMERIIIITT